MSKLCSLLSPYPRETLHSWMSRQIASHPGDPSDQLRMMGMQSARCGLPILLPRGLSGLADFCAGTLGADEIIRGHSPIGFLEPFLPRDFYLKVLKPCCLAGKSSRSSSRRVSSVEDGLAMDSPRYCPLCVEEDLDSFGEAFFHVEHLLPGIGVCVKHSHYLKDYREIARIGNSCLFSVGVLEYKKADLSPDSCSNGLELFLAKCAAQAMEVSGKGLHSGILAAKLNRLLVDRGHVSPSDGRLFSKGLVDGLNGFFSESELERLGLNPPLDRSRPLRQVNNMRGKTQKRLTPPAVWFGVLRFFGFDFNGFVSGD